jgi:hypothetical protein
VTGGREKLRDPSPVSPRLVKAPAASHPLPSGEGKVNSKDCRGGAGGRNPSSGPPRLVKTPVAAHLLPPRQICDPWEKAGSLSGGFRPDFGGGPPSVAAATEGWDSCYCCAAIPKRQLRRVVRRTRLRGPVTGPARAGWKAAEEREGRVPLRYEAIYSGDGPAALSTGHE